MASPRKLNMGKHHFHQGSIKNLYTLPKIKFTVRCAIFSTISDFVFYLVGRVLMREMKLTIFAMSVCFSARVILKHFFLIDQQFFYFSPKEKKIKFKIESHTLITKAKIR